jgi:hypothetical protein
MYARSLIPWWTVEGTPLSTLMSSGVRDGVSRDSRFRLLCSSHVHERININIRATNTLPACPSCYGPSVRVDDVRAMEGVSAGEGPYFASGATIAIVFIAAAAKKIP